MSLCKWIMVQDEDTSDYYDTECGESVLAINTWRENRFRFCPYCGGKIEEATK